jgi:hypothetical protein
MKIKIILLFVAICLLVSVIINVIQLRKINQFSREIKQFSGEIKQFSFGYRIIHDEDKTCSYPISGVNKNEIDMMLDIVENLEIKNKSEYKNILDIMVWDKENVYIKTGIFTGGLAGKGNIYHFKKNNYIWEICEDEIILWRS